VQESRERVQAAIKNANLIFPRKRFIVNLAPASVRKEGPAYDLPIAVGMLITTGQLNPLNVDGALFIGELSLDGSVRHVRGILPMAALARDQGFERVFVPHIDAAEAVIIPGIEIYPAKTLEELFNHLKGISPLSPFKIGLFWICNILLEY